MVDRPHRTAIFMSDRFYITNKRTYLTLTLRMLHASHAFCNLDFPSITRHATGFLYSLFHKITMVMPIPSVAVRVKVQMTMTIVSRSMLSV